MPTLQKTKLGWIVGGKIAENNTTLQTSSCYFTSLERDIEKFWRIEEPLQKKHFTKEELRCESHYNKTTTRESDGRYIVSMPFRDNISELGESKETAVKRFLQVEKRLNRDSQLKARYCDFMDEYVKLGHMEKINESYESNLPTYYLPHHPVIKSSSSTTKVRVVFDASAKTSSGLSLNDMQLVGPTVQPDIFTIIARFRMHNYVMVADLEKMYRQILIEKPQRDLLRIVWRSNSNEPLETYRLNTVTYGTASAPYLATRTLQQLAEDEATEFPITSAIVKGDFYVDDLMTGVATEKEGIVRQRELIELLSRGCFNLRKWNSNSNNLLENLPTELKEREPQEFPGYGESTVKTLGLWWDAEEDNFQFKYSPCEQRKTRLGTVSKRTVLSSIAKLFDPLGLIAPVIVRAKMLMQELWKLKLDWDESLPMSSHNQWRGIECCLQDLSKLRIPRQATHKITCGRLELHGFADASERAYGACIYLRHEHCHEEAKVTLLTSKSRVAPLQSTTLPRLELCAALLLSELMSNVSKALRVNTNEICYWTDSTVTLAWIRAEPARWATFVANRVAKIQEVSHVEAWRHVNTNQNPADLVSRGATAQSLIDSSLWWNGPSWLSRPRETWPNNPPLQEDTPIPEKRKTMTTMTSYKITDSVSDLIERHSSFDKLTRIIAYCIRFGTKFDKRSGPLTPDELGKASKAIIIHVQKLSFPSEIKKLTNKEVITTDNKLLSLSPFIDTDGLLRVGGRLEQSTLSYESKHPILLPRNNRVTEMIIRKEHLRNLHCGPQALLYAVRLKYWPINGRDLVRKICHKCVICYKAKPSVLQQKMGDLPATRVSPARPFLHTGVDYCGPFYTKPSRRRGVRPIKSYGAVFVCFATKAVHIELVSDLSTETFLGSLKRFIARRGICVEITSDNGKNFVGADRELKELYNLFKAEATNIIDAAAKEGIKWNFNPPYSPHLGGIWEAAVKSLKYHIHRVIGTTILTFEELTTVLVQIEAVLNSRPLTPLSNDPSDLTVLTPAHFLVGGSLKELPEPSLVHLPEQRLSRWQRVQRLVQHFWSRWSKEYLNNLQQRSKWKAATPPLQRGSLVLLKDDHLPPLSWPMGRVIQLHPGKDDVVRVATVKTANSSHLRSINKLCLLPVE